MNFRAIKSVFDENWLNDDAIKFVLELLNIMVYNSTRTDHIPDLIFGKPQDATLIVPTRKNYPDIINFMETSTTTQTPEMKKMFIQDMKRWYGIDTKQYLSKILDHYHAKSCTITKYANVININNYHWVYLCVEIPPIIDENNYPKVYTIDNMQSNDTVKKDYRVWYSKFFGLYHKESKGRELTDKDLDGKDIVDIDQFKYKDMKQHPDYSMFVIEKHAPNVEQKDSHNCGVYCLIKCLEDLTNKQELKQLSSEDQTTYLKDFRLRILSLIEIIYDHFYREYYEPYKEHLYCLNGDCSDETQRKKWQMIHDLFNKGH